MSDGGAAGHIRDGWELTDVVGRSLRKCIAVYRVTKLITDDLIFHAIRAAVTPVDQPCATGLCPSCASFQVTCQPRTGMYCTFSQVSVPRGRGARVLSGSGYFIGYE